MNDHCAMDALQQTRRRHYKNYELAQASCQKFNASATGTFMRKFYVYLKRLPL